MALKWCYLEILEFPCASSCARVPQMSCHHQDDFPSLGSTVPILLNTRRRVSSQVTGHVTFGYYLLCQKMPCTNISSELKMWLKHFWDFELACTLIFTLGVLSAAYFGNLSLCGDSRTVLQQRWRNILTLFTFLRSDIYPIIPFLWLTYKYILHLYF